MKLSPQARIAGWILPFVMLTGCSGGAGGGGGSASDDRVLAEVADRTISVGAYRDAALLVADGVPETPEARRALLDDLINKTLMEIAAYEVYPEPPIQHTWRLTRFRKTVLEKTLREHLIMNQIVITDEMKDQLYENSSRDLRVRGILAQDADEADYIRKRLDAGEEFASLADDHSMKWTGDDQGGELGWISAGTLPWPVDKALWAVPVGDLVGPITMMDGTYILQALEEREGSPRGTREMEDEILRQKLLQPLYMDKQMAMLDSLHAVEEPFASAEARQLLQTKYYWEPQTDNPMEYLEADRVKPTFTVEEGQTIIVDFKNAPDWTAEDFADRLTWFASGMWPRGHSDEQLQECLDLVIRGYLVNKAANDYGLDEDPEFVATMENREREMRVTYFYFNNILSGPDIAQAQIDEYFSQFRDRYQAAPSYKVSVFTSANKPLMAELAEEWRAGASFKDLRDRYEARDPELKSMGESVWVFEGQDPAADDAVSILTEGGVSPPDVRVDKATVYRLIARRGPRPLNYQEAKQQIDEDAKVWIQDRKLRLFLEEQRAQKGVLVHDELLADITFEMPGAS